MTRSTKYKWVLEMQSFQMVFESLSAGVPQMDIIPVFSQYLTGLSQLRDLQGMYSHSWNSLFEILSPQSCSCWLVKCSLKLIVYVLLLDGNSIYCWYTMRANHSLAMALFADFLASCGCKGSKARALVRCGSVAVWPNFLGFLHPGV